VPELPDELPLEPAPKAPPPDGPVVSGFRLAAAYRGNTYASKVAWLHGASLSAQWTTVAGPLASLGVAVFPDIEVRDVATTFHVGRFPLALHAGWRLRSGRLSVDLAAAYTLEIVRRRAFATATDATSPEDETRVASLVGARLGLELTLTPVMGLYVQPGMDLVTNNFAFVAQRGDERRTLLEPSHLRALVDVGVTVWP
jgi:hypothetical protein